MPPTRESKDYAYWDEQFTKRRREQLENVQAAAANWAKVITGLLGVFGTVAFAGGLTTIDKLPKDRDLPLIPAETLVGDIKIIVMTAFVLAMVATVLVALAAGEIFPRSRKGDGAAKLRDRSLGNAKTALVRLRVGQGFGCAAAALVLAGSIIIFLTPDEEKPTAPPTVVAITVDGVRCGPWPGLPSR